MRYLFLFLLLIISCSESEIRPYSCTIVAENNDITFQTLNSNSKRHASILMATFYPNTKLIDCTEN